MEAAMLLLGRTFPLRKCLKGHILVDINEDSHQSCTAELMLQRLQEQTDLQTATTEADSTEGWDGSPNCARCNRRMWRVWLAAFALFCSGVACLCYCHVAVMHLFLANSNCA